MKIICFKPHLDKYWKNGWSSEEVWSVRNKHWGIIDNKFYQQILIFQNLFKNKDVTKLNEIETYIASQITSHVTCTEEQLEVVKKMYDKDIKSWQKLQSESNMFYNQVCEFIAEKPYSNRTIRCCCVMGEKAVQISKYQMVL